MPFCLFATKAFRIDEPSFLHSNACHFKVLSISWAFCPRGLRKIPDMAHRIDYTSTVHITTPESAGRDRNVESAIHGRSDGRCSSLGLTLRAGYYSVCRPIPLVTAVVRKRRRSFCEKSWWQFTPKHAYTLDRTKSEWADYAVQA